MHSDHPGPREQLVLGAVLIAHIVACCVSLILVSNDNAPIAFLPATYHVFFKTAQLPVALAAVAAFSLVAWLFVQARFSFGYFVGFYLYTMVLGYLWLNSFTDLNYDHRLSGLSAATSAIVFLIPALFVSAPLPRTGALSETAFDRLLLILLGLAVTVVIIGASYNFRVVGIRDIYRFRGTLELPRLLNYLVGTTSGVILPFVFAASAMRKSYWLAGAALVLLLLMYPISLSKLVLFMPFWLIGLFVLSWLFESRMVTVLSLLAPTLLGIVLVDLFYDKVALYFALINFRMVAIPSIGLDVYNDFFSRHAFTYFCQISYLKALVACPYQEPLAIIMERAYDNGNFNASLFATEGVASVGPLFAPLSVMACGFVLAIGNRLSAGLPPRFILLSGGILPQIFLNVPLTITLLTYGAALLFLLWFVTPRTIFASRARPISSGEPAPPD